VKLTRVAEHALATVTTPVPVPWLVDPSRGELLSIMTPIYPSEYEISLLGNQLRSFHKWFDHSEILEWLFVTPEHRMHEVGDFLEGELQLYPDLPGDKVRHPLLRSCCSQSQTFPA
jgi:hypothetical protein